MIVQSCVGMFPFFFILMATVFMFALVNFQQAMMKPIKDPKKAPKFLAFLGDQYQTMFGDNPGADDMDQKAWMAYILFTVFISIVCLNQLIAVISDIYDQV